MNLDIMLIELSGNEAENVVETLQEKEYEISMHLAKGLIMAIGLGETEFKFAEVVFKDGTNILLGCQSHDYREAVQKQISILENYEEYEMCQKLKESFKKLN